MARALLPGVLALSLTWLVPPVAAETVVATRHVDRIRCLSASADGQWLASTGDEGLVTIWDAATGRQRLVFEGHGEACPVGLRFLTDGKTVVSTAVDGRTHFWAWDGGAIQRTLRLPFKNVYSSACTPDGSTLVTADAELVDGTRVGPVRLWEGRDGQPRLTLAPPAKEIEVLAVSPDGQHVAAACSEAPVLLLWAVGRPEAPLRLGPIEGNATDVAFSADGKTLASAAISGIHLWDVASGRLIRQVSKDGGWSVAFSRDGQALAVGSDGLVTIHETATGRSRCSARVRGGALFTVAFAGDDKLVAAGGGEGNLAVCSAQDGRLLWRTGREE